MQGRVPELLLSPRQRGEVAWPSWWLEGWRGSDSFKSHLVLHVSNWKEEGRLKNDTSLQHSCQGLHRLILHTFSNRELTT